MLKGLEACLHPVLCASGLDRPGFPRYHESMIETASFLFGLGFSFLVYLLSIRKRDIPAAAKAGYFLLTLIGITGMVTLIGVTIADRLRSW